jgi:hypothetical protein
MFLLPVAWSPNANGDFAAAQRIRRRDVFVERLPVFLTIARYSSQGPARHLVISLLPSLSLCVCVCGEIADLSCMFPPTCSRVVENFFVEMKIIVYSDNHLVHIFLSPRPCWEQN